MSVAVIFILLGILIAALDRAIHQAELAVCASNQAEVARGVAVYARSNNRFYPHRDSILIAGEPAYALSAPGNDDRHTIARAFPLNGLLNDPMCSEVDFDAPPSGAPVHADLNLWFGVRFRGPGGSDGMLKLGHRLAWEAHRVPIIVSDIDAVSVPGKAAFHTHPDDEGLLSLEWSTPYEDDPAQSGAPMQPTFARWVSGGDHERGTADMHAAFEDGATQRYRKVRWDDERMVKVPHRTDAGDWPAWYVQIPPR